MVFMAFVAGASGVTLLTNSGASIWTAITGGYSTTIGDFDMSYVKNNSSTNSIEPSNDHIRIYQKAKFKLENKKGGSSLSTLITHINNE